MQYAYYGSCINDIFPKNSMMHVHVIVDKQIDNITFKKTFLGFPPPLCSISFVRF